MTEKRRRRFDIVVDESLGLICRLCGKHGPDEKVRELDLPGGGLAICGCCWQVYDLPMLIVEATVRRCSTKVGFNIDISDWREGVTLEDMIDIPKPKIPVPEVIERPPVQLLGAPPNRYRLDDKEKPND